MSMAKLMQKRTAYEASWQNGSSGFEKLKGDETVVPVIVSTVWTKNISRGFIDVRCVVVSKKPVVFSRGGFGGGSGGGASEPPTKRAKTSVEASSTQASSGAAEEDDEEDGGEADPSVITERFEAGDSITLRKFDAAGETFLEGHLYKFVVKCDVWNGRLSYKISKTADGPFEVLNEGGYDRYIADTALAKIPTPSDFAEDNTYISFFVPTSPNTHFSETFIAFDVRPERMSWQDSNAPSERKPGLNVLDEATNKMSNSFVLMLADEKKRYSIQFGYRPELFSCYGCTDMNAWEKIGARLIGNTRGGYIFANSKGERVRGLQYYSKDPEERDTDEMGREVVLSTAFAVRMLVDVAETVRAAGLPITKEHAKKVLEDTSADYDGVVKDHPLNREFASRAMSNRACVANLTEISYMQLKKLFWSNIETFAGRLSFYGIFGLEDDDLYTTVEAEEQARPADDGQEEDAKAKHESIAKSIEEKGRTPVAVYAVISEPFKRS